MTPKTVISRSGPLIFALCLALTACGSSPIEDAASTVIADATDLADSSGAGRDESAAPGKENPEPVVVYASLKLQEDGRVKCVASEERGDGMIFSYTLDAAEGPADESAACVKALMAADQDAVRSAAALVGDVSSYLKNDPGVETEKLDAARKELEAALVDNWGALAEKSAAVETELADVKRAVEEKRAAEEEARKKAEAEKQKPSPAASRPSPQKSPAPPTKQEPKPAAPQVSGATSSILAATNNYRSGAGLKALKADGCAEKWAKSQAEAQAKSGSMFHQDLGRVMNNCGSFGAAENVAYGQPSAAAVVQAWFNSPGHRANMLNGNYTHMGAAVAYSANGTPYYAQVFLTR